MQAGIEGDAGGAADRALVDAVLSGDHDAFRGLVDRESSTILAICRRILAEPADAEDAAQETFLTAYRKLGSFRGEGPLGGWLMRIAIREAQRRGRTRLRLSVLDPAIDTWPAAAVANRSDPADVVEDGERDSQLRAAIDELPAHYRDAVRLRYIDERSYRDIAFITGRPEATVRTHLHRGLIRLRDLLTTETPS